MNVLIITQSLVNGVLLEEIFRRHTSFSSQLVKYSERQLLKKVGIDQKIDLILLGLVKPIPDLEEQLQFLHNLFGCNILLLSDKGYHLSNKEWVTIFKDYPLNPFSMEYTVKRDRLIQLINSLVKKENHGRNQSNEDANRNVSVKYNAPPEIVAIGASTGGPQVLHQILCQLPGNFDLPVLIVQHMPAKFMAMFVDWLNKDAALEVTLAENNLKIKGGRVYFAPGDQHMVVTADHRIRLLEEPPMHNVIPSASYLFRSVAEHFGPKAVGILLTGMGRDGAEELALMKKKGALTMVQSKETCIVFGMPGAALKLDAASLVLSPGEIAQSLIEIFNKKKELIKNA